MGMMLLMAGYTTTAVAQVNNDNEDGVYKVQRPQAKDYVKGEVLLKLKDGQTANVRRAAGQTTAGISSLDAVLKEYGIQDMEQLLPKAVVKGTPRRLKAYNGETIVERDLTQLYKLTLPDEKTSQTFQLIEQLKKLEEVEFAEPNYKMYIMADVDEVTGDLSSNPAQNPLYTQQWGIGNLKVNELWTKPIVSGKRPVIAVIDTGVDINHPDLADNIWTNQQEAEGETGYDNDGNGYAGDVHGWDFVNHSPNIRDYNSHGTHVAGIAAACDNGIGIIGANPKAYIMPITVMQSDGSGDMATIIQGINYAVDNGATILNMSLGTYSNSRALHQAMSNAYGKAVLVAAAGNDGVSINKYPMFPAAYPFVLGVMATTENGSKAGFSNIDPDGPIYSEVKDGYDAEGCNYEMSAPGANIMSTIPNGRYKTMNGTSMATPMVAGAISVLQMVKSYDSQEIMWGDLLHSNDFLVTYNLTDRPAELDLLSLQYNERNELTEQSAADSASGDGYVDAGETVSIYPVIRTTFGAASNIRLHLDMGDDYEDASLIDVISNDVDFGYTLSPYGKEVSRNPIVFKVADDVTNNRHIKLKLVLTCAESAIGVEYPFTIVVENMRKLSGLISTDLTLTADHQYLVSDDVAVMEGATLTIEPGTTIKFRERTGISSYGKIVAHGEPGKMITFMGLESNEYAWNGISVQQSTDQESHGEIYHNEDMTLFTLEKTDATPVLERNVFLIPSITYFLSQEEFMQDNYGSSGNFRLTDYLDTNDMTGKDLTNPNLITPAFTQMISDAKALAARHSDSYSEETPQQVTCSFYFDWFVYKNPVDTFSYCVFDGSMSESGPYMKDCVVTNVSKVGANFFRPMAFDGIRCNIVNNTSDDIIMTSRYYWDGSRENRFTNYVNNTVSSIHGGVPQWNFICDANYFNQIGTFVMKNLDERPSIMKNEHPSYLGTTREDLVRPFVFELGNTEGWTSTFGTIDLSNMLQEPVKEAHGIVWKVVVNGKDAQDEYEDLAPLGVGKHKFEVYFNRPMNKEVAPQIAFGVRDPWTQNAVNEDGSWNDEGTIYTAYKTITGKTKSDGVNRIYVWGAEDDEYFEIPYEKTRFNINVQAAGSMATGFSGEAGMGRVNLTWDNSENNFDDAMGFNIYRFGEEYEKTLPAGYYNGYKPTEWGQGTYYGERTVMVADTIRINQEIVDIETTEYTDYDVTPGETYYYMYKVLSTDLQEFDASNVVAVTPLTATLGDANGSGDVDVADVITTVNYAAGMDPKPFIFEAADMNTDTQIDILDVIGIIQKILNPGAAAREMAIESTAVYTVENGILFVETPVALAGVQAQLNVSEKHDMTVAETLNGFEHVTAWMSDNDMLFLAYNLNGKTIPAGKHALLKIGDAEVSSLRLSDAQGRNVTAVAGETTGINNTMGSKVQQQSGIFNVKGQKVAGHANDLQKLPKGVYIIGGEKIVK